MNTPHPNQNSNPLIDRALHQLGSAQPQPGMNDRILRRLQQAETQSVPHALFSPAFGWPRLAFAGLAGATDRADLLAYLRSLSDSPVAFPAAQ